ncbi:MAG: alpha/beta hydrolase [Desulfarculaceae bacterium]|nr:alpha/beta hydrolase [Desulfarculaceae bacterium]MCF8073798.1 alpha/beta hydrolase [Desulfarculaceae bacterium]MCF8102039.1 alpha/beta hydrolase [Desulfarculaceae bacterium]MCF8116009.1 alpha/beta hydrolase [Desulfarculaceae bacterium]
MWPEGMTNGEIGFYQGRSGFDPSRPSLLLLHGAGGRGEGFLPQLSGLEGINLAAVDLPGHRGTPGPGCAVVDDYAAWLAGLLATGPLKPVLLGHSMGGAIAQALALANPKLVKGLILMSTGPSLPVNPALLQGLKADFTSTVKMIVKWAYGPEADPALRAMGVEEMSQADPQVMHDDFVACDCCDLGPRLGGLNLPCLVMTGEQDKMTPPAMAQKLAEAIPGAELKLIPGAGHMPYLEKHREVNQAISEFMSRF